MRTRSVWALLPALVLVACGGERAPDTAESAASTTVATNPATDTRTDVLKNEYAEAFIVSLAPGQEMPAHDGGARAVYALSDYTIRITQDGQTSEQPWTAGQVHFHPAGQHSIANIGTTDARFLVVARTGQPLAPASAAAAPAAPAATAKESGPMQQLLDNEDLTVAEVRLPAGSQLPNHPGRARVVYSLSDYTIAYASNAGAPELKSFAVGEAHWHDADEHTINNTGSTEARFLIVQFKR